MPLNAEVNVADLPSDVARIFLSRSRVAPLMTIWRFEASLSVSLLLVSKVRIAAPVLLNETPLMSLSLLAPVPAREILSPEL